MIVIRRETRLGTIYLHYTGLLDSQGASDLGAAVEESRGSPVVIDLAHATGVQDVTLGQLFELLPSAFRYVIRGASHHHAWLLRCLGATVDERRRYPVDQSGSVEASASERRRSTDALQPS